jgi:hypothetical protein
VTLNFRIPAKKVVTYAGPEFLGCCGSARPVISCFKRPGWLVGKSSAAEVRVWQVSTAKQWDRLKPKPQQSPTQLITAGSTNSSTQASDQCRALVRAYSGH